MLVFLILYNESVPFAQKSQSRGKFGDLAIFVFVFAVFSKYFAGRLKHANSEFMQLCDIICMRKSVVRRS